MKKLIDAGHLKDKIINTYTGSWHDLYTLIALIDDEPEAKGGQMEHILLIPIVVFAIIILGILLYCFF
jgi:hypothetical protein